MKSTKLFQILNEKSKKYPKESLFKNPFEVLYGKSIKNKIFIEDIRLLYQKIKVLYDQDKSYSWFDFEYRLKKIYNISEDVFSDKIKGTIL